MKPTLRQLEYAVAVADHLHFGRAARACAVSQPALSVQIKRLEEGLGTRLFERSRRRVSVTAAGSRLVRAARAILREVADLVEGVRASGGPLSGTFAFGAVRTVAPYLLPRVLPELRAAAPGLRLLLTEGRDDRLLDRLADGRLDVLLAPLPVEGEGWESMGLYKESLVAVLPAGHPLAAGEELRESDLAGERMLVLAEGHGLGDRALEICRSAGGVPVREVEGTGFATLIQMVASGIGITLLPALAVSAETPPGTGVEVRPFERPAPRREIGLVWRGSSLRRDRCRALAGLIRSALLGPVLHRTDSWMYSPNGS